MAIHQGQPGLAKLMAAECRALAPHRGGLDKPLRVLICGIPNVGKSTLINTIVGKRAAATGDEPGITKIEQKILLDKGVYLFDTPGMLWPKIRVPEAGINLAASGAVGRNAFEEEVVALDLLGYLRRHYPQSLKSRYQLEPDASLLDGEVLALIGKRRGAVLSGGRINTQKAAEILLYDLRQGQLGRITLETPAEFAEWTAAAEAAEAAKLAEKEARARWPSAARVTRTRPATRTRTRTRTRTTTSTKTTAATAVSEAAASAAPAAANRSTAPPGVARPPRPSPARRPSASASPSP